MGIIDELYHGGLYPAEKIIPKTEQYAEARKDAVQLSQDLQRHLTPEQFALYEQYCTANAVMVDEMRCECFRQGVIFGVKMMLEIVE